MNAVSRVAKHRLCLRGWTFCSGELHRTIHSIAHIIEDHAAAAGYPSRFAATKMVEGDAPMKAALNLTEEELHIIEHLVCDMEKELGTDREAAFGRYAVQFY